MGLQVLPFLIEVPEAGRADLRRLRQTRWPEPEPAPDAWPAYPRVSLR